MPNVLYIVSHEYGLVPAITIIHVTILTITSTIIFSITARVLAFIVLVLRMAARIRIHFMRPRTIERVCNLGG